MHLRSFGRDDRAAYLREIRPRLLTLRLKAGRVDLRWFVPSWAFEEPLRFLLRVAHVGVALAPERFRSLAAKVRLPLGASDTPTHRTQTHRTQVHRTQTDPTPIDRTDPAHWWPLLDAFFSEADRDMLSLPSGVPLLDVQAANARIVVAEIRP